MFKAIKDNKIIAINETGEFPCLVFDEVVEDTEHTCEDYKHYDGEFTLHDIEKDNEEQRQARANAYAVEVDPLMAEYNRKKTFNLFEEGEEEALLAKVNIKVEEIKARYPYPVEESNNSDSVLSEAPENKGQSENDSKGGDLNGLQKRRKEEII